jgi:hypothetical protein
MAIGPLAKVAAGGTAAAAAAAVAVGAAAAVAVGAAADAMAAPEATAPEALADGLADAPMADCWIFETLPPDIARMIPRVKPIAIGMARGTAIRTARLLRPRRRHADLCPLSIQSTSMDVRCDAPGGSR